MNSQCVVKPKLCQTFFAVCSWVCCLFFMSFLIDGFMDGSWHLVWLIWFNCLNQVWICLEFGPEVSCPLFANVTCWNTLQNSFPTGMQRGKSRKGQHWFGFTECNGQRWNIGGESNHNNWKSFSKSANQKTKNCTVHAQTLTLCIQNQNMNQHWAKQQNHHSCFSYSNLIACAHVLMWRNRNTKVVGFTGFFWSFCRWKSWTSAWPALSIFSEYNPFTANVLCKFGGKKTQK